jgi:D-alanyl-D-alanine carboxypeptidase (penicillin-binding protein 5/6)
MKKRARIKKFIPLLLVAIIFTGYFANSLYTKYRHGITQRRHRDGQLVWPGEGQAAIGSVEEGVLARSSDVERVCPTASMAKVITALAVMEKQPFKPGQEGESYTITKKDIENLNDYISEGGSALPILIGMTVTQYQAMQRMLIASDNNMADILVEMIFGTKEAYLSYAKDMLNRMGLGRTIVADASGFDPATVSTPSELFVIGVAALKDPVIARIVAQQRVQLPVVGTIKNTNQLLGTNGIIGIKTGTTRKAGSCLLFAARYFTVSGKKRTIVGVVMGDKDHRNLYSDSRDLLLSAKEVFRRAETQQAGHAVSRAMKQHKHRTSRY